MAFGNQLDYFISFLLFSIKAVKLIHSLLHCVYLSFQSTPKLFEPNVSYLYFFVFDSIFHFRSLLHLIRKENIWGFEAAADAMQFQDTSSRSSCINLQLWTFAKCYHLMRFATQFPSIISSYMNKPSVNPRHIKMIFQSIFIGGKHARLKQRQRSEVSAHGVGWEQGKKLNGLSAEAQTTQTSHLPN